jgi:flagellar motor switch protein FliN/FliY
VNAEQALRRLASAAAEAAAATLSSLTGEHVHASTPLVVVEGDPATGGFPGPAVVIAVGYVADGGGGHVLVLAESTARRLAETITGEKSWAGEFGELGELERSALEELGGRAAQAAAGHAADVLGHVPPTSAPEVALVADPEAAVRTDTTAHAAVTTLAIGDDEALLVHLVAAHQLERTAERLERRDPSTRPWTPGPPPLVDFLATGVEDALTDVPVRVWAELGRAAVPLGAAARLDGGAIVELDEDVDDPITLYAGGSPFALGRLLRGDDGAWAVRIERLLATRAQPGY